MSATGKIVGVTTQSVMRWIRQMHDKFITEKPDIATVTEVEMDENQIHNVRKSIIVKIQMYATSKFVVFPHNCTDYYECFTEFFREVLSRNLKNTRDIGLQRSVDAPLLSQDRLKI